jgi:predicted flap endonuclease-1-like 5' DNA nuclease
MRQLLKIAATKRLKGARQTEIRPLQHVVTNATREGHSMNSLSALINLAIVWGVASATGFLAMAALMIAGDWTLLQALFAAAIIFFVFGTLLSFLFLKPMGGPVEPGKMAHADPAPTVPSMTPLRSSTPAASARAAPAKKAAPAPAPKPAPAPAPEPAPVAADPVEGTRPEALSAPRDGGADDLKRIKGIGPKLEKLCNSLGFYHFDQIANWTADEVAWVDQNLEGFKGRVTRDTWVDQARLLASGAETEFSKKVDKGDVY